MLTRSIRTAAFYNSFVSFSFPGSGSYFCGADYFATPQFANVSFQSALPRTEISVILCMAETQILGQGHLTLSRRRA